MAIKSYYYNIEDDLNAYPDAWAYIIIGGRNTGKTYGALKLMHLTKNKHTFVKRTIDDVEILCSGRGALGKAKKQEYSIDLSPYKSINRDLGTNIEAFQIKRGLGAFFECDRNDEPVGTPEGYLLALSAVAKFKGFDLSDCNYLIFDEFIPQPWERVNRKEGEQVMDLYKTVNRDREHRGRPPLKLLALANATEASNPLSNVLEITDTIVDMENKGIETYYDEERGIFIRRLVMTSAFAEVEQSSKMYKAMKNTQWGAMAFGNSFGYNDFSAVKQISVKHMTPVLCLQYKNNMWFVYERDGKYVVTKKVSNKKDIPFYDLNKENEQKRFFTDWIIPLRYASIEGRLKFETYTMYDVIMSYKKYFKI